MRKSFSSKWMQKNDYIQQIDDQQLSSQILQQLCNPDSVNLQQLINNLFQFSFLLLQKGILSQNRFEQVKQTIQLKQNNNSTSLSQAQTINILKWQIIIQFFSQMIILNKNNQKMFEEIYNDQTIRQCLIQLKGEQQTINDINNISLNKHHKPRYKHILKYVSFQTLACVLQLKLQVIAIKQQQPFQSQKIIYLYQQSTQRVFGFLDVGEMIQRRNLWQQVDLYFKRQFILNNIPQPMSNKRLMGYFYLGLVIESLQFESLNSSLRFSGELLEFIFNQLDSSKALEITERISLIVLLHLNRVIWFLRILKKNSYHNNSSDYSTIQQSVLNPINPTHPSRRSILGKGLTSTSKTQFINSNSHQSIPTSNFIDQESVFLNLLDEKVGKIMHKYGEKYKELKVEMEAVDKIYQSLRDMFAGKIPPTLGGGSENFSTYSIHSFRKIKSINFTDDQYKILFTTLNNKMKNLYKSLDIKYSQLFSIAKTIFVENQLRQKIQIKRQSIENKLVKTQLLKQFHQNLYTKEPSIKSIKILTKFSLQNKNKPQSSKNINMVYKNMYLPTLKPNINVKIQNRLKLKELKKSSSIKDQSFFKTHEDKKHQKAQKLSNTYSKNIKIGSAIKSKKNILIPSNSNEKLVRQKKSLSLPSKVKITTNYDIGSRFDRINFYQSTKNSVINRKFSYEMITCKRKKSEGQQGKLWKSSPRKISESKRLSKLQSLQIKKSISPRKKTEIKSISRSSKRRQSTILQSNIQMRKLTLNQKLSQLKRSRDQLFQIRKKSTSIQSMKNTQLDRENIFVKSINTILQNYKYLKQKKLQRGLLKLQRTNEKEKRHDYQDKQAINQSEQVNISTLKYQDASEILTSLEIYLRGCLEHARFKEIVERKYPFYLQLEQMNFYEQNKEDLIFFFKIIRIKRHSVIKKSFNQGLQNYWSTFQYFLQINDQPVSIDINERELVELQITLRQYIMREIEKLSKCSVERMFRKGFQYHMVGDLGGKIQHYAVKLIVWNRQCQNKLQLQQRNYQQKRQKMIDQGQSLVQKIQKYSFMKKYYQNPNIAQLIGLKPEKNTVDRVQLYITRQFKLKNQLKPIPEFVKKLLIDPLNQYIIDWAADLVPKAEQISEHMDKTIKVFQKRERKIYHIYFLNRAYQRHSRYKHIINRVESKYPRDSIKQSQQHIDSHFQQQQDFIQSVEILQFMCKNLIFNKKYIIFNIKILRLVQQESNKFKDYLMIEQKNSNFGNHKRIFFVFPLIIHHKFPLQHILDEKDINIKRKIQRIKYKQLIRQISKEVSLKNLSNFLIDNKMIQIGNWSDTMFNKLLLMYPYVTVIKKIAVENEGNVGKQNSQNNKRQPFTKHRTIIKNPVQSQTPHKFYVYATIKAFIIDRNNLVIGVVEISGQSFFFHCTFQYLSKKMQKMKINNLSRSGLGKGHTQASIRDIRTSIKSSMGSNNIDHLMKGRGRLQWKLSIKKNLAQDQQHSAQRIKHSKSSSFKSSLRESFTTTFKSIRRDCNIIMSDQHKMNEFKEKFKLIFKHGCELTIKVNKTAQGEQQKRMTTDNYQSKYSLAVVIQGQVIKVTECKYYWWDVVPETGEECVNFRLRDDSMMLIKLSFNSNFYIRKSNKIKIHYFQNYLKLVQQKRLKYKGAGMSSMIRNQDKLIYYESYKVFVQNLQRYHFVFSTDWVLSKIRLDHIKGCGYQVNAMNFDVEENIKQSHHKSQQKQGINFQLHTSELSNVDIPHMQLSKKMLNNTHFKKRMRSILDNQMQTILKKQQ